MEYIGVRTTTLKMDDGEIILMPNGDMYSSALTIRGAGAQRRMKLKLSIAYDAKIDRAKASILNVLETATGVVEEPRPSVYVTELAPEGVNLSIYFWIKTDETKPMEVIDSVATRIKNALTDAKIKIYPSGSPAVQNLNNEAVPEIEVKEEF